MEYAYPPLELPPSRRRCKVIHSPEAPARCRKERDHESEDHWFGWYGGWNLDLPPPTPIAEPFQTPPAPVMQDFDG